MATSKVFGIGLSRTATVSLTEALKVLGYKSIHYPIRMIRMRDGKLWIDLKRVAKFDALTDTPITRFYKKLDKSFPNSKFILTVRDIDSWLGSIGKMCENLKLLKWAAFMKVFKKGRKVDLDLYKSAGFDRKIFRKAYEAHIRDVSSYFKDRKEDLLVLNICQGEGWKKLCNFLDKDIPVTEFPKLNQRHSMLYYLPLRTLCEYFLTD